MKSITLAVALALGLGLIMTPPAVAQHVHESDAAPAASVPVPAQRYTPDASLKEGMRRARAAVDKLRDHETGRMSEAMAIDSANAVQEAVNYMFANYRLAPRPDAALHSILLPLLNAAQALKAHPGDAQPLADMRAALAHYPPYFADPGWRQASPVHRASQD